MTAQRRSQYVWTALLVALTCVSVARAQSSGAGPRLGSPTVPSEELPTPPPPLGSSGNAASQATAPSEMVEDVRIQGNKSLPLHEFHSHIRTRSDRPFDRQMVEEDVRKLTALRKFVSVDVAYMTGPKGGKVVIFRVVERPVLKYVKFVGNTVRENTVKKHVTVKDGDAADPYAVEESRRKLEEWYQGKGYPNARVTIHEGNKPGDRGAVFVINEGAKQKVWSVEFVGNTIVSGQRLKTQIQSKPPVLMLFKGEVDRKKIDDDVDRLLNYYRGLGFFRARIGREMKFDEDMDWLTLTFVIDEGPRYTIRNISVVGNQKISTDELIAKTKLKSGDFFDRETLKKDIYQIEDAYGMIGYIFSAVEAEPRFLEEPGQLDMVYQIAEGDRYHIGRVDVVINGDGPRTKRNVILNRMSIYPGQIADIRELRDSERRLKASGLFQTNPAQGEPPKVSFKQPEFDDGSGRSAPSTAGRDGGRRGGNMRGQSPDPEPRPPLPPGERWIDVVAEGNWNPATQVADEPLRVPTSVAMPVSSRVPLVPGSPQTRYQSPDQRYGVPAGSTQPNVYGSYGQPSGYGSQPGYASPANYNAPAAYGPQPAYGNGSVGQVPMNRTSPDSSVRPVQQAVYQGPSGQGTVTPVQYLAPPATGYAPGTTTVAPTTTPAYGAPANPYATPGSVVGAPPASLPSPSNATPYGAPGYGLPPGLTPGAGGYTQGDLYEPVPPGPAYGGFPGAIQPFQEPTRPIDVQTVVTETQTGRIQLNVGVNSSAGLVGGVMIDEQNFDWRRVPTSWEDIRSGRAFRGGGQQFRIEAFPGTQVSRYTATYRDPYFLDTRISYTLSGYYFQRFYQNWTEERTGGRVALGYQLTPDLSSTVSMRAENVNVNNPTVPTPTDLNNVLGNTALYAAKWEIQHDTRDSTFLATQGHLINLAFEQGFGTFSFPKFTATGSQYFLLHERPDRSGRHVLSYVTEVGIAGNDTPIYERFYAGGYGSLRGFMFRGVTPLDQDVQVGGRLSWLNSLEYLFPITADDMLRGVMFCDFGSVESNLHFDGPMRVALGAGLRISIPAMGPGPIALDFAGPVSMRSGDHVQNFSFFIGYAR